VHGISIGLVERLRDVDVQTYLWWISDPKFGAEKAQVGAGNLSCSRTPRTAGQHRLESHLHEDDVRLPRIMICVFVDLEMLLARR
jgi:hypothetical protein